MFPVGHQPYGGIPAASMAQNTPQSWPAQNNLYAQYIAQQQQRQQQQPRPAPPIQPYQGQAPTTRSSTPIPAGTSGNDATASGAARGPRARNTTIKGSFTKELKALLYGFGDVMHPDSDTTNVMEEILIEYISDLCLSAAGPGRKARLTIDDLRRVLGRPADAKKLARMEELLFLQEDIKRARELADFDATEPQRNLFGSR